MTSPDPGRPVVESSRLLLHPLRVRLEGDVAYVGRVDTGDFVLVPSVGARAIRLLGTGLPVEEVARRLRDQVGEQLDLVDFAAALVELGYVAAVDGHHLPARPRERPTFPWLRQQHVRWLLHPVVPWGTVLLIITGAVAVAYRPRLLPDYHDLVWDRHTGAVLAVNAAIGWTLVMVHELAHLATARAAGVPGRMSLSTRLQFLVVQTDVSGIWSAPRWVRMTVYLSGIALELAIAAVGLLVLLVGQPATSIDRAISLGLVLILASMPFQAMVFMRTDLYFVLQDLSRCPNLYAQGARYVRYWLARIAGRHPADPTRTWTGRERWAVRGYAAVLLVGTAGCLVAFVTIVLPATVTLAGNAIRGLGASSVVTVTDSIVVIVVVTGFQLLWLRAWLRRHGPRLLAWVRRRDPKPGPAGPTGAGSVPAPPPPSPARRAAPRRRSRTAGGRR